MRWRFSPMGDAAILAEAEGGDHAAANRAALAAAAALDAAPPPGFITAVPAIASLLVCLDPLAADRDAIEQHMRALLAGTVDPAVELGRLVRITVRYGGADGPDLDAATQSLGLTPAELVALHCAAPMRVMMIGFAPGYPYIGPLPPQLHLPRRATPRHAVPPGSVAIAAGLSGIYPARLPGGWHLIGRTDQVLFEPQADPPALLAPGDLVQFVEEC